MEGWMDACSDGAWTDRVLLGPSSYCFLHDRLINQKELLGRRNSGLIQRKLAETMVDSHPKEPSCRIRI